MKRTQLLPVETHIRSFLICHFSQLRIGQQSAPQHHLFCFRELPVKFLNVLHGKQIPIVTHRMDTFLRRLSEHFPVRMIFIIIRLYSWMNDQTGKRILIENVQKLLELLWLLLADSGLDGKLHPHLPHTVRNLPEKFVQLQRKSQESGAPPFGNHSSRRTAQIQIDLVITELPHLSRRPQEIVRLICQNLRNHTHPLIVLRQNIIQLPAGQLPSLIRCDKRRIIPINLMVKLMVRIPVHIAGNTLHRCKTVSHSLSKPFLLLIIMVLTYYSIPFINSQRETVSATYRFSQRSAQIFTCSTLTSQISAISSSGVWRRYILRAIS